MQDNTHKNYTSKKTMYKNAVINYCCFVCYTFFKYNAYKHIKAQNQQKIKHTISIYWGSFFISAKFFFKGN